MVRRITRQAQQELLMQKWWARAILAVGCILLAYGFVSLAIDSGSLLEYAVAIFLTWYGIRQGVTAVRMAF